MLRTSCLSTIDRPKVLDFDLEKSETEGWTETEPEEDDFSSLRAPTELVEQVDELFGQWMCKSNTKGGQLEWSPSAEFQARCLFVAASSPSMLVLRSCANSKFPTKNVFDES